MNIITDLARSSEERIAEQIALPHRDSDVPIPVSPVPRFEKVSQAERQYGVEISAWTPQLMPTIAEPTHLPAPASAGAPLFKRVSGLSVSIGLHIFIAVILLAATVLGLFRRQSSSNGWEGYGEQ